MEVLLTTTTFVAAAPPMLTVAPDKKPVPVIVTAVPPFVVPELGKMPVTVGAGLGDVYVYPLVRVPLCPSVFVTTTFTVPTVWAGVLAAMDVLLTTETFVAGVPPMLTVAPVKKPVPVIVTEVPPLVVPELGEIAVTVGALAVVKLQVAPLVVLLAIVLPTMRQ
jgi:hypothetical protein